MKKPVLISVLFIAVAVISGVYLFSLTQNDSESDSVTLSKIRKKNKRLNLLKSLIPSKKNKQNKKHVSSEIPNSTQKEKKWQDAKDYPHTKKLTNQFKRFHRRSPFSLHQKTPTVNLKIGNLFKRKQGDKTFNIREVLVSINKQTGKKNFIALVNEDNGQIIHRQGRRINEFRNSKKSQKRFHFSK